MAYTYNDAALTAVTGAFNADDYFGLDGTTSGPRKVQCSRFVLSDTGTLPAARLPAFTGDATSTAGTSALTLANSGVTAGSYGSSTAVPVVTVDAKGRVTAVSTASISGSLTFTGDVTGSGTTGASTALTLANSGVTAGTYTKVTVDAKGRVTTGASLASADLPTYTGTITSSQVTTALGFTPYNSTNPNGYITSSGTAANVSGTVAIANGGTGATTANAANTNVANWGQLAGHSDFATGFDTVPNTWGWTYVQSNTGAPHTNSSQWYRARVSLGSGYGIGTAVGTYWMEMAIPRYGQSSYGNLYFRTNENGTVSGWTGVRATYADTVGSITSAQVTTALGYTPYNSTNPNGYTNNTGTVTSVGGTGTVSGLTLTGTVTTSGNLTLGGTLSLTSANVTGGLGYTPENPANKGAANGYASLDSGGKVPSAQLPSYVDDVLEYTNTAGFPVTGETGKIYVALDTNKTYRWSGTAYIEISASPGSTDSVSEGSTNLYFTNARARSAISATGSLSYNSSTGVISFTDAVTSVFGRTGAVTLTSSDVTSALGFTPLSNAGGSLSGNLSGTTATFSQNFSVGTGTAIDPSNAGGGFAAGQITEGATGFSAPGMIFGTGLGQHGAIVYGSSTMYFGTENGSDNTMTTRATLTSGGTFNASNVTVNGSQTLHAGNYTSYSPSLTGSGASGTWGISITGSAASITGTYGGSLTSSQVTNALGYTPYNSTNPSGYITSSGSISGNAATATSASQLGGISSNRAVLKRRARIHTADSTSLNSSISAAEMGFTYGGSGEPAGPFIAFGGLGGDIDYSCQLVGQYNAGGNNFVIRTRNDDSSAWNAWRTILTDGNYTSYSPSLTGSGASGTWGINITGSASSITGTYSGSLTSSQVTTALGFTPLSNTGGTISGSLTVTNNITVSSGNATGGGIILADDGDIVDLNDGYCAMRFSYGVRIFSANRGGSAVITLSNGGTVTATQFTGSGAGLSSSTVPIASLVAGDYSSKVTSGSYSINITGSAASITGTYGGSLTSSQVTNALGYTPANKAGDTFSGNVTYLGSQIVFNTASGDSGGSTGIKANANGWTRIDPNGSRFLIPVTGTEATTSVRSIIDIERTDSWSHLMDIFSDGSAQFSNLKVGSNQVLHAGNYTSYSPSLTGSGASGTWGINITGSAASITGTYGGTLTSSQVTTALGFTPYNSTNPSGYITSSGSISGNAATATTTDNINGRAFYNRDSGNGLGQDSYTNNGVGYVNSVSLFGQTDGGIYTSAYSTSWIHQIYGDFRTGQIAIRGKNAGTWQAWRVVLDASNYSSYALPLTGGTVSGATTFSSTTTFNSSPTVNAYLNCSQWFTITGGAGYGVYGYGTNGAHFYLNSGSYGPWKILGSRNGWSGIEFGGFSNGETCLMIGTDSNMVGYYNTSWGWKYFWSSGTLYCYKGGYGGGSQAVVLDSSNWSSYVTTGGLGLASYNAVTFYSVTDTYGNLRTLPQNAQGGVYTLAASDTGRHIAASSTITVPSGTFSAGQLVTVYNNTASNISVNVSGVTMYQAGTANSGNRTLAQRGVATILCVAANTFVISGSGLS